MAQVVRTQAAWIVSAVGVVGIEWKTDRLGEALAAARDSLRNARLRQFAWGDEEAGRKTSI